MDTQLVIVVPAIVLVLIAGTVFSAWRSERAAERAEQAETEDA